MSGELEAFHALSYYTLAHGNPAFIHQHIVDAFAAQCATAATKPITLVFALIGLYLHVEKQFSGREVQLIHMKLAKTGKTWPALPVPQDRGTITVQDVLAVPEGPDRDQMISEWCSSVWKAYSHLRPTIIDLLDTHGAVAHSPQSH